MELPRIFRCFVFVCLFKPFQSLIILDFMFSLGSGSDMVGNPRGGMQGSVLAAATREAVENDSLRTQSGQDPVDQMVQENLVAVRLWAGGEEPREEFPPGNRNPCAGCCTEPAQAQHLNTQAGCGMWNPEPV